jgi:hypothetical protein
VLGLTEETVEKIKSTSADLCVPLKRWVNETRSYSLIRVSEAARGAGKMG